MCCLLCWQLKYSILLRSDIVKCYDNVLYYAIIKHRQAQYLSAFVLCLGPCDRSQVVEQSNNGSDSVFWHVSVDSDGKVDSHVLHLYLTFFCSLLKEKVYVESYLWMNHLNSNTSQIHHRFVWYVCTVCSSSHSYNWLGHSHYRPNYV